ncbi:transposon TX1 [Tanacetum coccineum]
MYCVREKSRASNLLVRESDVRHKTRDSKIERKGHIGNRWEYNSKHLGTNYTGGKRNSAVSFMFFNFPSDWGMGKLWMMFKKFGTVFDMYMVQKRLRNGEKYGFVRFKLMADVEVLLKRLREIKFGEEYLKVFIAYDRKNPCDKQAEGNVNVGNTKRKENGWKNSGWNGGTRDERNFAEVVNGERKNRDKNEGCLLGEVKSMCYLTKLASICGDQGLCNVEVKLLGGLEVLIVFDTPETATNIVNSTGHGLRRWVHKLRRWNKHYILPGRLTWINIIGVPVHTINKGLIKESLYVKVYGRKFKVEVIEEVGDVMDFGMEEIITNRKIENEIEEKGDENDMAISDNESCDESSEEGTESEEEGNEVKDDVGLEVRAEDDGGWKMEKDEESRFSGMSRVCETPEVEIIKKEEKSAKSEVDVDKTPREETCGGKENKEKRITCEKKLDTQDRDISSDKSRNIASQMKGVGNNGKMGQVNDVGPILSKTCIPDQNQIEMNMNGPKERNGHVRDSGAMDESSNVKIRRTRRGKDDIKTHTKSLSL